MEKRFKPDILGDLGARLGYLKKHLVTICLLLILASSASLMFFSSRTDSMVVDEKVHISAGILHVWKGNYLFNTEHPPLLNDLAGLFSKIAKPNIPQVPSNFNGSEQWDYGDLLFYKSNNNLESILFWARFPFIMLTLGLVYLCFLWGRAVFGVRAGLLAAALSAFSPNILAHGRLATTDIGLAFFFVLTIWLLRKYILKPSWKSALLLGISLGLALLAKYSGFLILPIVLLGVCYVLISKKQNLKLKISQILIIIFTPLILIWLLYVFSMREYLNNLPEAYELTKILGKKTLTHPWAMWLFIPFNKFLDGYQMVSDHNQGGHWAFINGSSGYNGWWYYFPLVLWYKLTLPVLALVALGIVNIWKNHKKFIEEALIIFPPLLFLAISMTSKIDIGIRHILPVLPFLFIFVSRLANVKNIYLKPLVWVLLGSQIIIGVFSFPNYIAYFNQIAGGSKNGIKHLSDSNIDWNQNMIRFAEYAKKEGIQKVYQLCWDGYSFEHQGISQEGAPNSEVKGVVVICAQQLVITPEGFDLNWITKYKPDAIIGNAMNVWRFDKK